MKKHIWHSSKFWTILFAIILILLIVIQLVLGILDNQLIALPEGLTQFVNNQVQLPMAIAAWFWVGLISVYCGFDRYVNLKETQHLSKGQMSLGNLSKLRFMMVLSLAIFLFALVSNFIVDKNFELVQFFSAFGSSVLLYVGGNKYIKANRFVGEDKDKDGIPDDIQQQYYKWEREQKKNGVEPIFITLDYFLDEHPELYKKVYN